MINTLAPYQKWPVFARFFVLIGLVFSGMLFFRMEESSGLPYLLVPVFVSWVLFYWSPPAWRHIFYFLPFFALLFYAFGLFCSVAYLLFAAFFIFWWSLPLPKIIRYALLLGIIVFFVLQRLSVFGLPRISLVIPYLASAFMFRWLIYAQEIKYQTVKEPLWIRIGYFLQPANLVFLLYPIVDYRKYVNSAKSNYTETLDIAIERFYRSLFHYLLYRLVYYYLALPYTAVQDAASLLQYAIAAYMFILHISAIYYFAIGSMGLFGFNLPGVFNFFFLPAGFAQLWARINVYWREFIMRIFYYPFYFRIRKYIPNSAIWVSTIYCFVCSWFMHTYQLFWLKGSMGGGMIDFVYWMVIGTGVTITVYLIQHKRILPFRVENHLYFSAACLLALRVITMFLIMSFLWILWQCESLGEWFFLLRKLGQVSGQQVGVFVSVLVLVVLLGATVWILYEKKFKTWFTGTNYIKWVMPLLLMAVIAVWAERKGMIADKSLNSAFGNGANMADQQSNEQGYYDQIIAGNSNRLPWEIKLTPPLEWTNSHGATIPVNNVLMRELKPSVNIRGNLSTISTNRWGMRDKEYPLEKGRHTTRFLIMGASYEAGSGVENNEVYEAIAEDSINRSYKAKGEDKNVEIMNMALLGYYLPQDIWIIEHKAGRFKPDYMIYTAHGEEGERLITAISKMVMYGIDMHYDFLLQVKKESGVHQWMSRNQIRNRLYPYAKRLLEEGYTLLAKACKQRGIQPVWMYVPVLNHKVDQQEVAELSALARSRGFITLSLGNAFQGQQHLPLMVSASDNHPNVKGHRVLARALTGELLGKILNSSR